MELVEQISMIMKTWRDYQPKSNRQRLFEYQQRSHLWIMQQASTSKKLGAKVNTMRNFFRITDVSPTNYMSSEELQKFYKERDSKNSTVAAPT